MADAKDLKSFGSNTMRVRLPPGPPCHSNFTVTFCYISIFKTVMRNIKLSTITLKRRDFKEKDRIVTFLTRELGKFDLIAKGVQKPGSKFSGISEPLAYGSIVVSNLKNLGIITSCDLNESFSYMHSNLNILSHGFYLLELVDKSTAYENPSEEIFDILYASLIMLEENINPETVTRFFESRLINILGYKINTEKCIGCGKELNNKIYYNQDFGGFFCNKCNVITDRTIVYPYALISYMDALNNYPIEKIKAFNFPEQVNKDLSRLFKHHLAYRIEKNINSLDFILNIKK